MAVISSQTDSVMVLEIQTGSTVAGAPILSCRSINVKAATTDQDLFDVRTAMQALSEYPLISVRRENHFDLAAFSELPVILLLYFNLDLLGLPVMGISYIVVLG